MKAVILAGGLGTRISEETHLKPKPMIEIGGKPILWHIMKIYSHYGVNDFVICCGYRGYVIKEYFANYFLHMSDVTFDMRNNSMQVLQQSAEPWQVTLIDTGEETLTGGRLLRAAPYVKDEEAFCFTYGDGVSNVNIDELVAFHKSQRVKATLTATLPPGRFGALDMLGNKVRTFEEKPKGDGGMINGGFFVLSPAVLDLLDGDDCVWERGPLETLAKSGELAAYQHHGFWQAMDTLRDKTHLDEMWQSGQAPLEGLVVNPSFWLGKRVFLTGHTGFKGGWLSLWLQQLGAVVTGYALQPPTTPNLFEKAHVGAGMTSIIGDIRDGPRLQASVGDASPDIAIHMAAQPLVRRSYVDPVETYSTNVMGTVHLLEAVRQCANVRAVVNVTTDKCYENREWLWPYRENEAMGGYDPYSSSKGCAELVTAAYRNSYFNVKDHAHHRLGLATARAGNVIGGGDWSDDRLIPDILRAFSRGEPVMIRNPHAVRPWQHVLEPLRGYLTLAERLFTDGASYAEAFNFGPREDDARSVEWIVSQLAAKWGNAAAWRINGASHPHEASLLRLDVSKAAHRLAWRPALDLDSGLQLTVDWVRAEVNGRDMRKFTLTQIDDYQVLCASR